MHTYIHTSHIFLHKFIDIYVCTSIYTQMDTHVYLFTYAHIHTHVHTHILLNRWFYGRGTATPEELVSLLGLFCKRDV